MIINRLLIIIITITLLACKVDELTLDSKLSSEVTPTAEAGALSKTNYKNLTAEQQYQVANKLAGSLFQGVPADEFFDFDSNSKTLKVSESGKNFLEDTRAQLIVRLDNKGRFVNAIDRRHSFDDVRRPTAEPLAAIREFPISRDMFEEWMAYNLANTILFSPAEEIESANYVDVQRIYDGLVKAMSKDTSIRDIIFAHMTSQANWRRFRSPEDNTREMIEIYLGLFDRDADVPKASIACKNWYLSDGDNGYELIKDFGEENNEPQKVLDQWITTCEDFYQVVANHPLVIPRITTYLVDRFFPTTSSAKRNEIVKDIVAQNPIRFHDVFTAILFSEEYLLNNEKPKSFEEAFFNIAQRISWNNTSGFLNDLTNPRSGSPTLHKMKQPAMALKLGRFKDQPMDSLSFAYYHSAMRERLLARVNNNWGSWGDDFLRKGDIFEEEEYINFLFLSVLSRQASQVELDTMKSVFLDTDNEDGHANVNALTLRREQTRIVFDYISQLPELYFYPSVNNGVNQ